MCVLNIIDFVSVLTKSPHISRYRRFEGERSRVDPLCEVAIMLCHSLLPMNPVPNVKEHDHQNDEDRVPLKLSIVSGKAIRGLLTLYLQVNARLILDAFVLGNGAVFHEAWKVYPTGLLLITVLI